MMQMLKQLQTLKINSKKLPNEIWILAYPGYAISNMGRWYSISRGKIMKQNKNSSGYKRCTIYVNGTRKHVLTHIKVVELFGDAYGNYIPEGVDSLRKIGLSIDHLDKNRCNPRQSNLELCTHVENCLRRTRKIKPIGGYKNDRK